MSYGRRKAVRRAMWGVVLIGIGIAFLLDQAGTINLRSLGQQWWRWWPAVFIVAGLTNLIAPLGPRHIASGLMSILTGLWFFGCQSGWHGMSYATSWPLLIVGAGVNMVVGVWLERIWGPGADGDARSTEEGSRHASLD